MLNAAVVKMEALSDREKTQIEEDSRKRKNYSVAERRERKRREIWCERRRKRNDERRGKRE